MKRKRNTEKPAEANKPENEKSLDDILSEQNAMALKHLELAKKYQEQVNRQCDAIDKFLAEQKQKRKTIPTRQKGYIQQLGAVKAEGIGEMLAKVILMHDRLSDRAFSEGVLDEIIIVMMKADLVPRNTKLLEPGVNRLSQEYLKEFVSNNPQ